MDQFKRPAKIETDEDLLKQQEQFLKECKRSATQCVSNKSRVTKPIQQNFREESSDDMKLDGEDVSEKCETESEELVLDVIERNSAFSNIFEFKLPAAAPFDISDAVKNLTTQRKSRSAFAELPKSFRNDNVPKKSKDIVASVLVDGIESSEADEIQVQKQTKELSEADGIHEENLAKVSAMSEEEIFQNVEKLKSVYKPEILNFIKNRKLVKNKKSVFTKELKTELLESKKNSYETNLLKEEYQKHDVFILDKTLKKQEKAHKQNLGDTNLEEADKNEKILRKEGNEECDALILEKSLNNQEKVIHQEKQNGTCKEKHKDFVIPQDVKQLIEGNEKGLWRNMNKIEKEKLAWMTDLPQPKLIDSKTGYTARFDFEGKLLEHTANIPTYEGLHHHGKEAEVPGYSLEELFLLARSSLQSQRITALNIIAHILENNWCGMMDCSFETPLLPLLLNAGIVPLLRWALDDTSLTSISATISAIHSLLISKADEACLKQVFCWTNGHFVPQLEPVGLDEPNLVIEELTDGDLIKLDVVKGFLRIDTIPRFVYILKVMCPPPLVCKLMIEIVARLAQHSPESAMQIAEHQGFLDLIFEKFLPLTWNFVDCSTLTDTVNYNCPMYSAVKLIRIIASSNRNLAISLNENYDVLSLITTYLTLQPIDGKLPAQDVQLLVIKTLKFWHTYLCYGISFSLFLNLFPIFLKQLDFCLSINFNIDTKKQIKDLDYAAHLFKAFEAVAFFAAEINDRASSTAVHVVFKKTIVCLKKWIWQFSQEKTETPQMGLLGVCMNFIVNYCRISHEKLICEDSVHCSDFKEVFQKYLVPAIKSTNFQNVLKEFKSYSMLLSSTMDGNKRDGKTIVSLGSVCYGEDIVPILKDGTALPLLSAVMNYVLLYQSLFQTNNNEVVEFIFSSHVIEYLKAVCCIKMKHTSWFLQFETYYIYQLIKLSTYVPNISLKSHAIAISALSLLTMSEESIMEDLFENVIFNEDKIFKMTSLTEFLSLNEKNDLKFILSRLPVIAQCYSSSFSNKDNLQRSKNMFQSMDFDSLFRISMQKRLICKDWCLTPIFSLYQKSKQKKRELKCLPEETLQIACSLQWIYLCHILDFPVLKEIPASAEFYYLCMVFLLDEDLFRDDKIKDFLTKCVQIILKQKKLNLSKIKWNDINKFDDLYLELLVQYEAVSYGDELFGNFLLLPLQQHCRSYWKKVLFLEHADILSFLRVPLNKTLVPLESFLEPVETDVVLLQEYYKNLVLGTLNHLRCPVLHLMAVHHVHNFIFLKSLTHQKSQKDLLSCILRSKKDLQKKILLYLKWDITLENGFCMSEELSPENADHLTQIMGKSVCI